MDNNNSPRKTYPERIITNHPYLSRKRAEQLRNLRAEREEELVRNHNPQSCRATNRKPSALERKH